VRTIINGLLRGSRPVVALVALLAVVGVTGTAYAKLSPAHHGNQGNANADKKATESINNWKKWHKVHHPKQHPPKGNDNNDGTEYGVATVNVSRGGAPATVWATYSTALGSPVGDNTGGVFRFTCSTAQAPCTVSLKAGVLSDGWGTAGVYPRVLIHRQDFSNPGPEFYCEYGDGSTGVAPATLTKQALSATPTLAPIQINIGFTADCSGPVATAGDVNQITVGPGYYDVDSTFVFIS
jgi:hypothetical protein